MALEKTKPAVSTGGHRVFSVTNWKAYEKNTLRGFLSVTLPCGLVLHSCTLHEKGGARWIGLPARQYTGADGNVSWSPMVGFTSKQARDTFQNAALVAISRFMAEGGA